MTKPKYTEAERAAARKENARKQMLAQWEQKRQESGDSLGYYGCHRRVRETRGRAAALVCAGCGNQARHWAHIHGTDPADPQNYQPMCQPCHWVYDGVGARSAQTTGPEGRRASAILAWSRRTPEQRKEIGRKIAETRRRNQERRDELAHTVRP